MGHQHADAISCKLVLLDGDDIWLVREKEGHFSVPGGRIDEGETPEAAARREAREEIGANLKDLQLADAWFMLNDPRRGGQDCLVLLFVATIDGEPANKPSADGEQAVRVPLAELEQHVRKPYAQAVRKLQQQGRLAV